MGVPYRPPDSAAAAAGAAAGIGAGIGAGILLGRMFKNIRCICLFDDPTTQNKPNNNKSLYGSAQ